MFFLDHYEETLERKCFHDDCAETETSTYTVDIGVRNERPRRSGYIPTLSKKNGTEMLWGLRWRN
ncbi:hypothetical protein Moror_4178 [Moniliophthora roreri MCA 2997]|uniref:Uncharacterized protein n=1 Tax=Moniliophthora roreri (strain MCA 2997) TaxID=1381753 RepID=V2XAB2_MONRO|nr:hypothetical protein Moror_4178 [Moniliophthora roreri MCA 2997]